MSKYKYSRDHTMLLKMHTFIKLGVRAVALFTYINQATTTHARTADTARKRSPWLSPNSESLRRAPAPRTLAATYEPARVCDRAVSECHHRLALRAMYVYASIIVAEAQERWLSRMNLHTRMRSVRMIPLSVTASCAVLVSTLALGGRAAIYSVNVVCWLEISEL